jgi:hypothetical protein
MNTPIWIIKGEPECPIRGELYLGLVSIVISRPDKRTSDLVWSVSCEGQQTISRSFSNDTPWEVLKREALELATEALNEIQATLKLAA